MPPQYLFVFTLILSSIILDFTSGAVPSQNSDNAVEPERESDGSFKSRDSGHYGDSGHNVEFDHEAILGSVKEAEEFDKLPPEEAKKRLSLMLPKMDLDGDKYIDRSELKKWILNSFNNLAREEASERMTEADMNQDNVISWSEYLQESFGIDNAKELSDADSDTATMLKEEEAMWSAADKNQDGVLDAEEFEVFTNPEEHAVMHPYLVNQTLREKDTNKDGQIDLQEYIGERGSQQDREWLVSERDKFEHELDVNKDGVLDHEEIQTWLIPNNEDIADEEVDHLFSSADTDHDDRLSYDEVIDHHDVFVGSEATDYGHDLLGEHFDDEL